MIEEGRSPLTGTFRTNELIRGGVLAIGDGYRAKHSEFSSSGLPFARAGNVNNGFHLQEADLLPLSALPRIGAKVSHPGDVVFTSKGTVGRFSIVTTETPQFVYAPQLCYWRSLDRNTLDPQFLYYWMHSVEFLEQVHGLKAQTDMAEYVSLADQRRMRITLPPSAEQRAIAHILGALDDKIEVNRRMNRTLEELAAAIFRAWFVDFEPVRAKAAGRAPVGMDAATAALFPDRLVASELGEIPEGWTTAKLEDVSSYLRRGISPKYVESGGVRVLNQKCVRDHWVNYEKSRRHDNIARPVEDRLVHEGDILVNSTGVGTLGRVAQVLRLEELTIVDSHVTVVRTESKLVSSNFLGLFLIHREPEIEALGEGSTGQTELSRGRLGQMRVLVPPPQVVDGFDNVTVPLRRRMQASWDESQTLAELRETLLPRLLSGEMRVPEEMLTP